MLVYDWPTDLPEMGSLSSSNRCIRYLLCVVDVVTKYAWVRPLKNKKSKTVLKAFNEMVTEFNCKQNKLCVDQGR